MDYTENLSLIKPAKAEQFNIDYHNTNSDIIDAAFKAEVETRISVDTALQEQIDLNRNEDRRIGTVPIAKGGTGETTAQSALNALHGSVATESSINAEDEITFIRRTAADASAETPETIDLKDVTLQTLADKVYDLIRGDSAVFSSTKNGLVPKSGAAGNALYLNAAGGWTEPGFTESTMDIASSREVTVVSNTILTFTASQSVTVVLKNCDKRGVTATFFNPTSFRHTLSLRFFGGSDTAYIKAGETVRLWWTGSAWLNLALSAHGVNSLYWSSDSTDPKYIYGGTWKQITDKFIYAAGSKEVNATGGCETVKLTESNLPAHMHSFSGTTGNESEGHTHSGSTDTMGSNYTTGEMSGDSYVNHPGHTIDGNTQGRASYNGIGGERYNYSNSGRHDGKVMYIDLSHTHDFKHIHSFTTSGASQPHTHYFSGNTDNKGNGHAFSILPPYIVKFCWERTA